MNTEHVALQAVCDQLVARWREFEQVPPASAHGAARDLLIEV